MWLLPKQAERDILDADKGPRDSGLQAFPLDSYISFLYLSRSSEHFLFRMRHHPRLFRICVLVKTVWASHSEAKMHAGSSGWNISLSGHEFPF